MPLLAIVSLACGCEPLRGVVAEKDQGNPVDLACVTQALQKEFGAVERRNYTSGGGSFPNETPVVQFSYFQSSDSRGQATLEVGKNGHGTRLKHSFTGAGSKLPQEDFPPAFKAMDRAASVLKAACGLDLGHMRPRSVGQQVDGLDGS
jgi:hypothetical protein